MITHQWFLAGTVESETMLSRRALEHIYDNVKARTASIGSVKRGPLGLHCARRARIQIRYSISCELIRFILCSCTVGGRRDNPEDPWRLLGAFNRTNAVAVPDAASSDILAEGILPSAAEAAAWLSLLSSDGKRRRRASYMHESRRRSGELPALCSY
jgi:hypothetical protein